jgi:protein-disulfide isomerase
MQDAPRPVEGASKTGGGLRGWKLALLSALVGALVGAGVMMASSGFFVRRYLIANPEVLPEAMNVLQEREIADQQEALAPVVAQNRAAIETPYHGAWAGAVRPDVVLVEFFDYACGFCRTSNEHIDRLLREDPRLRVVWREFPVLGPDSEQAAIASLAAARAGRYRSFYDTLFAAGRPTPGALAQARLAAGLGEVALDAEARAEIEKNIGLARVLRAQGTPTFVVGDQVFHGAVGYETLRDAVTAARSARAG